MRKQVGSVCAVRVSVHVHCTYAHVRALFLYMRCAYTLCLVQANQTFARLIFSVAKEQIVLDGIAHNESHHCHLALLALAVCAAYTCESAHHHGQPKHLRRALNSNNTAHTHTFAPFWPCRYALL